MSMFASTDHVWQSHHIKQIKIDKTIYFIAGFIKIAIDANCEKTLLLPASLLEIKF